MKTQLGYSIVEVLVSVLVLAVGFLGMAGLQATSLQNAQKSVMRTQAAYLSYEILDRMRANAAGTYATTATDFPAGVTNCVTNQCGSAALAAFDLAQWKCALGHADNSCTSTLNGTLLQMDSALPNGSGAIAVNGNAVTITIQWDERRDGSTDVAGKEEFVLNATL